MNCIECLTAHFCLNLRRMKTEESRENLLGDQDLWAGDLKLVLLGYEAVMITGEYLRTLISCVLKGKNVKLSLSTP